MLIFPAIDIINGQVVRLKRGNYNYVTKYLLHPRQAVEDFIMQGADHVHIVDLDGARSGNADNAAIVEELAKNYKIFIEVGGGIRTEDQVKKYFDSGVSRVILGTAAVSNHEFVEKMCARFGEKLSVGVDANGGKVAISGWEDVTSLDSLAFCKRLQDMGVDHIIYTDISRDGCLNGTNLDVYRVLCQTLSLKITASGGISHIDEILKLKDLNVYAAIIGKAIYEGVLNLSQAIEVAKE